MTSGIPGWPPGASRASWKHDVPAGRDVTVPELPVQRAAGTRVIAVDEDEVDRRLAPSPARVLAALDVPHRARRAAPFAATARATTRLRRALGRRPPGAQRPRLMSERVDEVQHGIGCRACGRGRASTSLRRPRSRRPTHSRSRAPPATAASPGVCIVRGGISPLPTAIARSRGSSRTRSGARRRRNVGSSGARGLTAAQSTPSRAAVRATSGAPIPARAQAVGRSGIGDRKAWC